MSGSISLSLSQQFNSLGEPLNGGLLYTYAAGTTTPQSAYQDSSLTLAWPNPIVLDSAGRVPPFYLADGQIKIRLADSAGVTQVSADNLLVVGASSGSGTAPTVDATTILDTGDIKIRYGTGALTGFVRLNGRTVGSATSGGAERANADCQDLFEYLWGADANLSVSTGRGASANADWVANKTITLPDGRGRVISALDDMGNSAAGRRTTTYTGVAATALGSVSTHGESHTLTAGESAVLAYTTGYSVNPKQYSPTTLLPNVAQTSGAAVWQSNSLGATTIELPTVGTMTTTTNAGGNPHSVVDPTIFMTIYMKL